MRFPLPKPGLVIRYDYVWRREQDRLTGKERPACLVAMLDEPGDPRIVLILPITHSEPHGETVGIEVPDSVGKALGLDSARSWIIVSEANVDFWPNPGLVPAPGKRGGFAYGFLPPVLFETVRATFFKLLSERRAHTVRR